MSIYLFDPITDVLNGCRHRKDTELIVIRFISVQNWEERLVVVKQYKCNKNLGCCFFHPLQSAKLKDVVLVIIFVVTLLLNLPFIGRKDFGY